MMDPFNPNSWPLTAHEHRIYGDDMAQTWAVLDEVDYWWAVRWRWNWSHKRNGIYLRRTQNIFENHQRVRTETIYLHTEIMKRTGIAPKSSKHCIVDHRNGDTTNNRRINLRWANHSQNAKNSHGKHPTEFEHDDESSRLLDLGHQPHSNSSDTVDLFSYKFIQP